MSGDDVAGDYAALASLYSAWTHGASDRYALVTGGTVHATDYTFAAARRAVLDRPDGMAHALVVALQPLGGWRHPRFVVEVYRRSGNRGNRGNRQSSSVLPVSTEMTDPLARAFLLAESLSGDVGAPDELQAPYLLLKDGAVLGRYKRVTQARQAVDAAMPPLAPVVFTSLRLGNAGPWSVMVLQALVERLPM